MVMAFLEFLVLIARSPASEEDNEDLCNVEHPFFLALSVS